MIGVVQAKDLLAEVLKGKPLDLETVFGRHAPRHLEIGCGNGETLMSLAAQHPENDYLGIEVYRPG